ncbi:MAG: hypothetical protein V7K90_30740 [Nostoc sp.]|uniref:hypothetical protein n=1 Tax=Nostoc sp. TaxID=1180 RepID=UPI002FFA77F6
MQVNATKVQVDATKVRVNATKVQVNATKVRVNATKVQVDATKVRVNATKVRVNATKVQVDATKVPRDLCVHCSPCDGMEGQQNNPVFKPLSYKATVLHTSFLELRHRLLIPPTPLKKGGKKLSKSPFLRGATAPLRFPDLYSYGEASYAQRLRQGEARGPQQADLRPLRFDFPLPVRKS